jgi:acyl-CoA thioester hydrolase
MGFVYYGNYASYYEAGRVEALRNLGLSYKKLEENGIIMPVLNVQSQFLQPAKYDELICLKTMIREMPKVKIQFFYEIQNEEGRTIHTGETTLAFLKKDSLRPCRCPEEIVKVLTPYFA